jgi:hypothetical protein
MLSGVVLLMTSGISSLYAQAAPLDFSGAWETIMMMNGRNPITLTIVQNGDQATASLPGTGKIEGVVSGRVLRFTWRSDRGTGSGRFVMDEEQRAFYGTINRGSNPDDVDSTWNGVRLVSDEWRPGIKVPVDKEPQPIPGKRQEGEPEKLTKEQQAELEKKLAEYEEAQKNAPATFAGAWRAKVGESYMELILQQRLDQVTGQVNANSAKLGVITDGRVVKNTLRFTIVRERLVSGAIVRDQLLGSAELVMEKGEQSFTGTILGAATSGTLLGR